MQYKFRAECQYDVDVFKYGNEHEISNLKIENDKDFPDVYVTFDSDLPLEEIIYLMREVEDGHVMYQTLRPIQEYTGERNYDL
jgi:hypothetical protein